MHKQFRLLTHQKGDTIVEVLIAVVVLTSVLGVVYSTMNRNLGVTRNNQERTEASKVTQGQIEALKGLSKSTTGIADLAARGNGPFCVNSGVVVTSLNGALPRANLNSEIFTEYPPCVSTFFHYVIRQDSTDPSGKTYIVTTRWDAFSKGRSEIKMYYRIP